MAAYSSDIDSTRWASNFPAPTHSRSVKLRSQSLHRRLTAKLSSASIHEHLIRCEPISQRKIQEFARDSTIHGLLQILRPDQTRFMRLVWAIAFLVATIASFVLVAETFARYLRFEIKTTMSTKIEDKVDFPAITFCNENMLKKSLVGGSREIIAAFTAIIVTNWRDYEKKRNSALRTCFTNVSNEYTKGLMQGYDYMKEMGFNKVMYVFAYDSYKCTLSCWWQDRWTDCSHLFLNHITDFGWCFTFNPSPKLLKSLQLGLKNDDMAYGVKTFYDPFVLCSTGPNNGFKVLLDTHQDEYCVTRADAAGFKALVHDPSVQPLFFMERPLALSPGFESNVAIRYTKRIRKTEHLGKCVKFKELSMYAHAEFYFKEACYLECLTYYIYASCNCTPLYGPPMGNRVVAKMKNVPEVKICFDISETLCLKKQERNFLESGVHEICKDCLDPCESIIYDIQISTSYFPANNFFHLYDDVLNKTLAGRGKNTSERYRYLRKNLALANFYVESMQINVVTERQAMEADQLLADMGGQIGFLLGASLLSVFEIVDCCLPRKQAVARRRRKGGMSNPSMDAALAGKKTEGNRQGAFP